MLTNPDRNDIRVQITEFCSVQRSFFCLLLLLPSMLSAQCDAPICKSSRRFSACRPISTRAENTWYHCRMLWLRNVDRQRLYRGKTVVLPSAFALAFEDSFEQLNPSVWRIGQPWGRVHPGQMHEWYSDAAVQADSGLLRLRNFYSPDTLNVNGMDTLIPYQAGLLCSDVSFTTRYGYFEMRSKNPTGPAVWPAFWLAPVHGWPPEIDIMEMYGKRKGRSLHRLTNSLHYGSIEAGTKGQHVHGIRLPANTDRRFYTYACRWEPDVITFYLNGYAVHKTYLNKPLQAAFDTPMYMIINNSLQAAYLQDASVQPWETVMQVDYVRVFTRTDL